MSAGALAWLLRLALAWSLCLAAGAWAQPLEGGCAPRILAIASALDTGTPGPPDPSELDWTAITLPDQWTRRWPQHDGAVWYRIDWQNVCPHQPVALGLNTITMAGEIFVNQEPLWRDRHLSEPLSRSWNLPRYWQLPPSMLQPGSNSLWIRVHGIAQQTPGLGVVRLGAPEALRQWFERAWWDQRTLFVMGITVSGVLCILFGCAWLQNPSNTAFGWFALNTLCWALFMGNVVATEAWPFPSTLAAARANLLALMAFNLSWCLFNWRFGEQTFPRLEMLLWCATAAAMGLVVFAPAQWMPQLQRLGLLYLGLGYAVCLQFPFRALQTRKLAHLVYAACLPVFLAAGVHDLLLLEGALSGSPLMPYTSLLTMLALAIVLGRQVMLTMRRIERFNQELSQSVAQACDDLGATLEREHALELRHSRLQERLQISHDLHDSLGGSLVRSIALVEQAEQPLRNAQFLSMLKLMRDDLRQMIDNGTSASLQVPQTPPQWIAPLRHRFGGLFEELDLAAQWELPEAWRPAPTTLQCLALTRVLEEALTNVIKHSRARQVRVELQQRDARELLLCITDDGQGFDVPAAQSGSLGVGLRSMRARLERVHGTLQIESQPGRTRLQARLQLDGQPTQMATADRSAQ